MRLFACLIVAPQRGYDEPATLSYAISSFCPTSADGLQSSHLRETGRWPLRGEGEWRVGIRTCRQNPETVGPRPWISRLCSFQIRWATGSPLLCRCPARNLGFTEPCDHWSRRCARAASGHAAAAPLRTAMNSRRFTRSPRRRLRAGRLERRSERHQRPAALAGGRGAPARKPHAFDALIV